MSYVDWNKAESTFPGCSVEWDVLWAAERAPDRVELWQTSSTLWAFDPEWNGGRYERTWSFTNTHRTWTRCRK